MTDWVKMPIRVGVYIKNGEISTFFQPDQFSSQSGLPNKEGRPA